MLGTPFLVIWLVGFIADLDIDSWLLKGLMYCGVWVTVQFLSKYVTHTHISAGLGWVYFSVNLRHTNRLGLGLFLCKPETSLQVRAGCICL